MVQTTLKDGSFVFLGILLQLENADGVEAGEQDYCAIQVDVKGGIAAPRATLARSRDLHACIRTLRTGRSAPRTFFGAELTFEAPSNTPGRWDGDRLSKLQPLAPPELTAAMAHLELA